MMDYVTSTYNDMTNRDRMNVARAFTNVVFRQHLAVRRVESECLRDCHSEKEESTMVTTKVRASRNECERNGGSENVNIRRA